MGGPQILMIGMKGTNYHSTIYETKNVWTWTTQSKVMSNRKKIKGAKHPAVVKTVAAAKMMREERDLKDWDGSCAPPIIMVDRRPRLKLVRVGYFVSDFEGKIRKADGWVIYNLNTMMFGTPKDRMDCVITYALEQGLKEEDFDKYDIIVFDMDTQDEDFGLPDNQE